MKLKTPLPAPQTELQRLVALRSYEILDSEPELEFDALTRIAAQTFNVPVAVVAMMDSNRLWFKSKVGLDIPELDRKIAFCAHTITTPDRAMVVDDLLADARFSINPLVSHAPHLRFYAAVPLIDAVGNALGTLAIMDVKARSFSAVQLSTLMDLATLVMLALQGRKREIELKRFALTDYLTGIANRAQFDTVNATEMGQYIRFGIEYAVICMDLDGFKNVNDDFGHPAGDHVLCEVAKRLTQQLRSGDVLARLGGDEFGVVARHCNQEEAQILVQRFTRAIQQPIRLLSGQFVNLGISCGICTSKGLTSAVTILEHADAALYRSKAQSL